MAKKEDDKTKLKDGGIRKTFIINELLVLKAEKIGEIEQRTIRNVVEEIFAHYIAVYEKQNGEIVTPDKSKITGGLIMRPEVYEMLRPEKSKKTQRPSKLDEAKYKEYLKKNSPEK